VFRRAVTSGMARWGRRAARSDWPRQAEDGTEPDARFTFANERTFLAWNRTALALVVAGLAIIQLLPPFAGVPWGRHLIAVPLIVLGAVISVASYLEWRRDQRALRRGEPLPRSALPRILAGSITALAVVAAVLVILSAALK
jgi:putative membrane protein